MPLEDKLSSGLERFGRKVGHCRHCVFQSALFFIGSWILVAYSVQAQPPSVVFIAFATVLAVVASCLVIAHAAAFGLRRMGWLRDQELAPVSSAGQSQLGTGVVLYALPVQRSSCCGRGA
jgi:hypothetical protein